jgi:hypothetical protein
MRGRQQNAVPCSNFHTRAALELPSEIEFNARLVFSRCKLFFAFFLGALQVEPISAHGRGDNMFYVRDNMFQLGPASL